MNKNIETERAVEQNQQETRRGSHPFQLFVEERSINTVCSVVSVCACTKITCAPFGLFFFNIELTYLRIYI